MVSKIKHDISSEVVLSNKSKRGFTLTEIAIVLGIIGLILGAIWVAASAVYNNMRVSRGTTELLSISQRIRAMYATSATVDPNANMAAAFAAATAGAANATYIAAGVFPTDTVNAAGTIVTNPWNGGIAIVGVQNNAANDSFAVAFDNVPTNACINFITTNSGTGRDTGLLEVRTGAAGTIVPAAAAVVPGAAAARVIPVFPVGAATAQAACSITAVNAVGFSFRLRG